MNLPQLEFKDFVIVGQALWNVRLLFDNQRLKRINIEYELRLTDIDILRARAERVGDFPPSGYVHDLEKLEANRERLQKILGKKNQ